MVPASELLSDPAAPPEGNPAPAEAGPGTDPPLTVIEARTGWGLFDAGELARYRELLFFLTWRDIKVRYKQTVLGAAWALLQPLATTVVFSLFFGRVAGGDPGATPYPLFVFTGLLPWMFLAAAVTSAGNSIVGNQQLVTKVYFPRLIVPASAVGAGLVDFLVAFVLLLPLMPYYGAAPGWRLLLVPLLVLALALFALGVGTLLSALTVAYRDFRYVVPFSVQLWMFATPAIYLPAEAFAGSRWQALLPLNPAHGLIHNFRQAVLNGDLDGYALAVSGGVAALLLFAGCVYFRRVERSFADVI